VVDLQEPRCSLHREVAGPFLGLRAAAAQAGIDLVPVSSFRDFWRQQQIWNGKCRGERDLLGGNGVRLDPAALDQDALVSAILKWSALPGASRHHWGTDLDVIDAAALPPEARVRLEPDEYAPGGVFSRLNDWLDAHAAEFGFYRPYLVDRGGVQPEPWHLSYAPLAQQALAAFSVELLQEALEAEGIDALGAVRNRLPEIVQRYVLNVEPPPLAAGNATPGTRRA
jgi:LAS superfamily LD-carboxypeptidase LdcB